MDLPVIPDGPSTSVVVLRTSWRARKALVYQAIVSTIGALVILLAAVDTVINNWAVNDYLGNGYRFITPFAAVSSASDLPGHVSFLTGQGIDELSHIGGYMLNDSITDLVEKSNDVYILYVGLFSMAPSLDLCRGFQGLYSVTGLNTHFGVATDAISFVRGSALTHIFTNDASVNLGTASSSPAQLEALGYSPARRTTTLHITNEVKLKNTSAPQVASIGFFRLSSKSYCTGCTPIGELGYGTCNMTLVHNATSSTVAVASSSVVAGADYHVGLLLSQSAFSSASHYVKTIAIVFAVGGFLASRRTVQWKEPDPNKIDSAWTKLLRTVSPKYFPYPSHALRFDMFTYNSDIFVFLFSAGVILDMGNCLYFLRHVSVFSAPAPRWSHTFQIYALTTRLLWLNCATLKLLKLLWNAVSTPIFDGDSRVMGFLNWSSVATLYASGVVLVNIPTYIDYSNSVSVDLSQRTVDLDPLFVDALDGYYLRTYPAIIVGIIANVLVVTLIDCFIYRRKWQLRRKNSLARQAIYNSTSILCDYLDGIEYDGDGAAVMHCKARRLSTLQWFFSSHLVCFGLPEKQLRARKRLLQSSAATTHEESSATTDTKFIVAQDGEHNLHLVDGNLVGVTSLVYNIKILKDSIVLVQ
ncbi:hypothetical protein ACHHYP_04020 [Achlya hypogyna]|uniref:Transmembrane protein n=1 Tax=Achlya hypogyna TaxID=1202772 RepID=A0A1V9Z2C7_ACHHY|nr:hypothetical protein ACHHYP_04020 [Achlya hypogyna]